MKNRRVMWISMVALFIQLTCSRDNNPTTPSDSNVTTREDIEQQIHALVKAYRAEKGLSTLSLRSVITEQARIHSQNMATGKEGFSHNGFEDRISMVAQTIKLQSAAENVAYNYGYDNPAQVAVDGWIKSDGHRKNMEGKFNLTGIGVAEQDGAFYFTQIFVLSY